MKHVEFRTSHIMAYNLLQFLMHEWVCIMQHPTAHAYRETRFFTPEFEATTSYWKMQSFRCHELVLHSAHDGL